MSRPRAATLPPEAHASAVAHPERALVPLHGRVETNLLTRRPPLRARTRTGGEIIAAPRRRGPLSAEVAALVGHELRTPLTTALVYISVLEQQLGAWARRPSVRSALEVAREEIRRLERLVVRVTELQSLGHPVMQPRLTEVGRVVARTVRRTLVGSGATPVSVTVATTSDLTGWWDDFAIEQIIQNLLSNALKFGRGLPVRISVEPAPSGVRLVVQDQGEGIGRAEQEKIFGRYVRSVPGRAGGLGLGLWLVRKLAQAHGGWVTVRSRSGQGATFSVTLRQLPPGSTPAAHGRSLVVPHRRSVLLSTRSLPVT